MKDRSQHCRKWDPTKRYVLLYEKKLKKGSEKHGNINTKRNKKTSMNLIAKNDSVGALRPGFKLVYVFSKIEK